MRRIWAGLIGLGAALGAGAGGVAVFAPQVPVLVAEGFPAPTWPARGVFVDVVGVDPVGATPIGGASNAVLTRFTQADGRALILDRGGAVEVEIYGAEPAKSNRDEQFSPFSALGGLHVYGLEPTYEALWIEPSKQGVFHYQSANTALLGRVVEVAYGQPLHDLLSEVIWKPAGAATASWRTYSLGEGVSPYCCLYATARDWQKVGRFILDNGTEAAPLLPDELWQGFVNPDLAPEIRSAGAYGAHLRHDVLDRAGAAAAGPFAYFFGHGGQLLYLLPDQDAVVVRFGGQMQLLHSTLYELLAEAE